MKAIKLFAIALLGAITFASCSSDEEVVTNDREIVLFTGDIGATASLRASGTTWDSGDGIGIFMVENSTTTISENTVNRQYTTTGNGFFSPETGAEIFFPVSGLVDFIAYYPYQAGAVLTTPYAVSVASQASPKSIDLLWSDNAKGYDKDDSSVPLVFSHQLSKLVLNVSAGNGVTTPLTGMGVSIIGMNTTASFNLATGALTSAGNVAAITPYTTTDGSEYEAIILPGSYNAGDLKVTFTVGSDTYTWDVGAITFVKGTEYTYNISLSLSGVTISGTINPWAQEPGKNVIAK